MKQCHQKLFISKDNVTQVVNIATHESLAGLHLTPLVKKFQFLLLKNMYNHNGSRTFDIYLFNIVRKGKHGCMEYFFKNDYVNLIINLKAGTPSSRR